MLCFHWSCLCLRFYVVLNLTMHIPLFFIFFKNGREKCYFRNGSKRVFQVYSPDKHFRIIFLCFSFRFEDIFTEREGVEALQVELERIITRAVDANLKHYKNLDRAQVRTRKRKRRQHSVFVQRCLMHWRFCCVAAKRKKGKKNSGTCWKSL